MSKIEVGSEWVAKVDYPYSTDVVLGEVVKVVSISGADVTFKCESRPHHFDWEGTFFHWGNYFKPSVETTGKIEVESEWKALVDKPWLSGVYLDEQVLVTDIDDTGNVVDNVNSPSHYGQGKIEAIEYISDFLTPEEYQGYLRGNIAKYLHRFPYKNGIEDLKKAQWYLERLIQEVE